MNNIVINLSVIYPFNKFKFYHNNRYVSIYKVPFSFQNQN